MDLENEQELPAGHVVAEDVAIKEVKDFVDEFKQLDLPIDDVKDEYPYILKAVQLGLLSFDEEYTPTLKLKTPVKSESGDTIVLSEINFLTRITTVQQQSLSKGLNLEKEGVFFGQKCLAYIIGQPVRMLDKFGRFDKRVIPQIASLFLAG